MDKLPLKGYFYASLALILFTSLSVVVLKSLLPPVVPLFYGRATGETQLVPAFALLIAPGFSLLFTLINLGLVFLSNDLFLKKILILGAFAVSLLSSITVFKIIFLVGFF